MLCWMDSSAALQPRKVYALKHTTRNVRAMVTDLRYRLDISTMHRDLDATELELNEIGRVVLRTTEPIFADELIALARHRGLVAWGIPGPRRAPDSWLGSGIEAPTDLAALTSWVPDVAERDVYVCGPAPWADLVVRDLRAAGVPDQHVHVESFGW
jgi:hypothetical protein